MTRTQGFVAAVGLLSLLIAWLLVGRDCAGRLTQRRGSRAYDHARETASSPAEVGLSPRLGGAAPGDSIEWAVAQIVSAADPFRAAAEHSVYLRATASRALALARDAWDRGAYWAACAILGVVRASSADAIPWLSDAVEGGDASCSAAAALGRWFIDSNTKGATAALVALHARYWDDAEPWIQMVMQKMEAEDAPVLACLLAQLGENNPRSVVAAIRTVDGAPARVVPVFEALVEDLASAPEERRIFGVDEEVNLIVDLVEALASLGDSGREAVVRLLYSWLPEASLRAEQSMLAAPHRFSVSEVLRWETTGASSTAPIPVYEVLASLPCTAAEWDSALGFVSGAPEDARRAFLDRVLDADLTDVKQAKLVETVLNWLGDSRVLDCLVYDALTQVAPHDPRTSAVVEVVLSRGTADQQAAMLARMASDFGAFSAAARDAALEMTLSDVPAVRAGAVGMLAQSVDTLDDERAVMLVRRALQDEAEEVIAAALKAMASRGPAMRSLIPLALARSSDRLLRTQLEVLRAICGAGAEQELVEAQVRSVWAQAAERPVRDELLDGVVDVLEEYQDGGPDIADLAAELLATAALPNSTKSRLQTLSGGRR